MAGSPPLFATLGVQTATQTAQMRETAAEPADELTERILDASLVLVARWGVGKTSLADVAKEAGCSRATVYRAFPGGKQHLFHALGHRELTTYLQGVIDVVDAADDLRRRRDPTASWWPPGSSAAHDAAQFIVQHEHDLMLPFLGFKQADVLYRQVSVAIGPHLERFVPPDRAEWLCEWVTRLFTSYQFNPDPSVDLVVVADARALVETFVLPSSPRRPPPDPSSAFQGATTMSTNEEIIGRADVNDLEAILADHQHRRRRGRSTR